MSNIKTICNHPRVVVEYIIIIEAGNGSNGGAMTATVAQDL